MKRELAYEDLVADFNQKLTTQLRGHAASADYLEMWVPDEDPVKSIINMVESAQAYGQTELRLRVRKGTLSEVQLRHLISQMAELGQLDITPSESGNLLVFTEI